MSKNNNLTGEFDDSTEILVVLIAILGETVSILL